MYAGLVFCFVALRQKLGCARKIGISGDNVKILIENTLRRILFYYQSNVRESSVS